MTLFVEIHEGDAYCWDGEMPGEPIVGDVMWLQKGDTPGVRAYRVESREWRMNHNAVWWLCLWVKELPERGLRPI